MTPSYPGPVQTMARHYVEEFDTVVNNSGRIMYVYMSVCVGRGVEHVSAMTRAVDIGDEGARNYKAGLASPRVQATVHAYSIRVHGLANPAL